MSEQNRLDAAVQQKLAVMFAANKDEVSIPKIYIDITGDIEAAAVLDELLFWTLPKRNTGKTSLRVFRNGGLWLAVRRSDWWERKRLTARQADTAIEKLSKLELVEKDVFLFSGKPTVHLRLKTQAFAKLYGDKMQEMAQEEQDENLVRDIADLYAMMGFPPENVISNLQNGEMLNLQNGEIINNPVQPENTSTKPTARIDRTPEEQALLDKKKFDDLFPQSQDELDEVKQRDEMAAHYEREMGYNPLQWWTDKKLMRLLKFLVTKTPAEITTFAAWSKREYSPLSPTQARKNPDLVIECWPQACQVSKTNSTKDRTHWL